MIVVYTAYSHADALSINSLLHASGVDSILFDYNHATLQSHMILSIGIRIGVPDEQKDLAIEVIEEFKNKKQSRPPFHCTQPGWEFHIEQILLTEQGIYKAADCHIAKVLLRLPDFKLS